MKNIAEERWYYSHKNFSEIQIVFLNNIILIFIKYVNMIFRLSKIFICTFLITERKYLLQINCISYPFIIQLGIM